MGNSLEATETNFDQIIGSDKPVLVDFWAEWCGPCKMIGPVVEELANDFKETLVVAKVDVDSNPRLSVKYGIRSIPALMIFKNGVIVEKMIGFQPKAELKKRIEAHI
ncbi:MAG: thioredoxin [Bacteroidetes bacterium]|nr:MAG: thioredoxin [Bacteroidota bacterium]